MIIKSMSRKVPSFGQLIGYIDRDEGQEPYRIRHNVWGRDPELIQTEFERNGDLLPKRKNGVYLYHEIISITRAKSLSPEEQMARLHDIAENYIAARCPDNLVFGGLHQDKEHSYHYHLMISSNRAGETGRLRLTKAQFREVQVGLERHVLETYPELEQKIAIDKRSDRGRKKGEAELERRTGKRPKREEVLERVLAAYETSGDRQSLLDALGREGLELYVRGKTLGVVDLESGKKHRLKTLDLETADRVAIRMESGDAKREQGPELTPNVEGPRQEAKSEKQEKSRPEGEKEKAPEQDRAAQNIKRKQRETKEVERKKQREKAREKRQRQKAELETDNEGYVNKGSNTDLKRGPSMQNPDAEKEPSKTKQQTGPSKEEDMRGNNPPPYGSKENIDRRVKIDRGEIEPDPERDIMSHEDWRKQDTFRQKFGASWRRTYDELHAAIFPGKTQKEEPKQKRDVPEANRDPEPKPERSSQQDKWREEISQRRDSGRDEPEQGRE